MYLSWCILIMSTSFLNEYLDYFFFLEYQNYEHWKTRELKKYKLCKLFRCFFFFCHLIKQLIFLFKNLLQFGTHFQVLKLAKAYWTVSQSVCGCGEVYILSWCEYTYPSTFGWLHQKFNNLSSYCPALSWHFFPSRLARSNSSTQKWGKKERKKTKVIFF